jgi:hypothetical protein
VDAAACSIIPFIILLDITVVLPFIRTLKRKSQRLISRTRPMNIQTFTSVESQSRGVVEKPLPCTGTWIFLFLVVE